MTFAFHVLVREAVREAGRWPVVSLLLGVVATQTTGSDETDLPPTRVH